MVPPRNRIQRHLPIIIEADGFEPTTKGRLINIHNASGEARSLECPFHLIVPNDILFARSHGRRRGGCGGVRRGFCRCLRCNRSGGGLPARLRRFSRRHGRTGRAGGLGRRSGGGGFASGGCSGSLGSSSGGSGGGSGRPACDHRRRRQACL